MSDKSAKYTGIIVGIIVGLLIFVILPMKSNYDQCGKITLCKYSP